MKTINQEVITRMITTPKVKESTMDTKTITVKVNLTTKKTTKKSTSVSAQFSQPSTSSWQFTSFTCTNINKLSQMKSSWRRPTPNSIAISSPEPQHQLNISTPTWWAQLHREDNAKTSSPDRCNKSLKISWPSCQPLCHNQSVSLEKKRKKKSHRSETPLTAPLTILSTSLWSKTRVKSEVTVSLLETLCNLTTKEHIISWNDLTI